MRKLFSLASVLFLLLPFFASASTFSDHVFKNYELLVVSGDADDDSFAASGLGAISININDIGSTIIFSDDCQSPNLGSGVRFKSVSVGSEHTCAVSVNGTVYCWGRNLFGSLGDDSENDSSVPVKVFGDIIFDSVSAGSVHSCAISIGGDAYCWGDNDDGALGSKELVSLRKIRDGGELLAADDSSIPVKVSGVKFSSVSAATSHTCGISLDGYAYCWGDNVYNQLNPLLDQSDAVIINYIRTSHSFMVFGSIIDTIFIPVRVAMDKKLISLSSGGYHSCAISDTNKIFCWGSNDYGGLGDGSVNPSLKPSKVISDINFTHVSVSNFRSEAVSSDGDIYYWGANHSDSNDGFGAYNSIKRPVKFPTSMKFKSVSMGTRHSCGLSLDNDVYCWSHEKSAENRLLGVSGTTSQLSGIHKIDSVLKFKSVSVGTSHSCALSVDGGIICWGDNSYGQLGAGDKNEHPVSTKVVHPKIKA